MPFSTLKAGFASTYIDARNYARHTADEIRTNMDTYITNGADYIAPYTSLITSSMMGKTRLMKEMSRYIPLVYICARSAASTGYPPRTPAIIDWFDSHVSIARLF